MTPRTESSPADLVHFKWRRMEQPALYSRGGRRLLAGWQSDEMYEPMRSEPGLFQQFASLSDDPEDFIAFATAYGDLKASGSWVVTDDGINAVGRPLELWRAHRRLLAFTIDLWGAIKAKRTEALIGRELRVKEFNRAERESWIHEDEEGRPVVAAVLAPVGVALHEVWLSDTHHADEEIHNAAEKLHQAMGVPYQDTIAYLERRNLSPAAIAGAALAQLVSRCCRDLSVAMVVTTSPGAPLRLTFQVDSLIAAMWLQLALAIDGEKEYRSCPVCGRWWDATTARSDKLTCSDKCRKSRQRARTREATEEAE